MPVTPSSTTMRPSWIAALLLAPAVAAADDGLFTPLQLEFGVGVTGVTSGDVDGDGLPDLAASFAVGFPSTGGARLALNLDGFHFAPPVELAGTRGDLLLTDLDLDGLADLVQCDLDTQAVTVRLSLGGGAFGPVSSTDTAYQPVDPHVADMNGDGLPDVVVAATQRVSVLLGNGDGSLQPSIDDGPVGGNAESLTLGDFDEDGFLDVAVANVPSNTLSVLLGAGDGSFGAPTTLNEVGTPGEVESADLNADGHVDLVALTTGVLRVRGGHGDGSFGGARLTPFTGVVPRDLELADLDEDGLSDAVLCDRKGFRLLVFPGEGDLTFAAPHALGASITPTSLDIADLDSDGDLDLVVFNMSSTDVTVLHGEGNGFTSGLVATSLDVRTLTAADFDGDGRLDVACGGSDSSQSPGNGNLPILLNQGNGRLLLTDEVDGLTYQPGVIDSHDHDGDGIPDLLTVGSFASAFYRGVGDGTFESPVQTSHISSLGFLETADLDGDGNLDTVSMRRTQARVNVNLGHGDGSFEPTVTYFTDDVSERGDGIALADVDDDGFLDAVMAVSDATSVEGFIKVFQGAGDGTFAPLTESPALGNMRDLVLADFDADGLLDVAATVYPAQVLVERGLGGGVFDAPALYDVAFQPWLMDVGDLDRNGVLDLAVACTEAGWGPYKDDDPSSVCVLLGVGDGSFAPAECLRMGPSAAEPLLVDIDGDGWEDLVVAVAGAKQVAVLLSRLGPWQTLVHGLPGSEGIPRLTGEGTLQGGDPMRLSLRDALPSSTAYLALGFDAVYAPFRGGVLVPDVFTPPGTLLPLPVGPDGSVSFEITWPAGVPSGVSLWLQDWLPDPGGPLGFSASNALLATTP